MSLFLGNPILVFLSNLYYHGVTVAVRDGQLRVGGETGKLSPVYRDEIKRRAEQLIDLLSPPVPDELAPYFGRLIRVDETMLAAGIAERMDIDLRLTPVNGGWLATMGDGSQRPSTRREARQAERGKEARREAAGARRR